MAFPVVELCASLINSQKAIWEGEGEKNKTLIKDFVEKTPFKQSSIQDKCQIQENASMEQGRNTAATLAKCLGLIASERGCNLKECKIHLQTAV